MKTSNSVVEISARPRGLEQESASLNAVSLCIHKNNFKLSLCKEIKQRSEEQLRRRGKLEAIFCTIWKKGLVLEQRLWSWRFSGLTCSFQQDHVRYIQDKEVSTSPGNGVPNILDTTYINPFFCCCIRKSKNLLFNISTLQRCLFSRCKAFLLTFFHTIQRFCLY